MKDKESTYLDEVYKVFEEGGTLWIIERTDTNEFPVQEFKLTHTGREQPPIEGQKWSKEISFLSLSYAFLKKEDCHPSALIFMEGGCLYCGNGNKVVLTELTEHEFVPDAPKNKCIVCEMETDNAVWCDMHTPLV